MCISVFRRHKCCASHNCMFYEFFCLIAHHGFTIIYLLHHVLMKMCIECLILGCYYLNSLFLPLGLSYITMPEIFLYLLVVFEGHGRIAHALVSSSSSVFSFSVLDLG